MCRVCSVYTRVVCVWLGSHGVQVRQMWCVCITCKCVTRALYMNESYEHYTSSDMCITCTCGECAVYIRVMCVCDWEAIVKERQMWHVCITFRCVTRALYVHMSQLYDWEAMVYRFDKFDMCVLHVHVSNVQYILICHMNITYKCVLCASNINVLQLYDCDAVLWR